MASPRSLRNVPRKQLVIALKEQEIVEALRKCGATRAANELQRVLDKDLELRREHADMLAGDLPGAHS